MSLLACAVGELGQFSPNLPVALGDLAMMELVQVIRLPQLEEVFGLPAPRQGEGDLFLALVALRMAQSGEPLGGRVGRPGLHR